MQYVIKTDKRSPATNTIQISYNYSNYVVRNRSRCQWNRSHILCYTADTSYGNVPICHSAFVACSATTEGTILIYAAILGKTRTRTSEHRIRKHWSDYECKLISNKHAPVRTVCEGVVLMLRQRCIQRVH